ncbi:MAG TPA: rhodanese-like domain-containing protein [Ktedonosporobacter sp.]|nr:rhodanese-like domain-containing protein [Ktedonosporobacter sp.]
MNTISVETLHAWLEEGRALTLLDVRQTGERAEGAIAGSVHLDAYDALQAHDPAALAALSLPTDRPVVTICTAGKVASQVATEQIAARGLQAFSLEGGVRAWRASGYPLQLDSLNGDRTECESRTQENL